MTDFTLPKGWIWTKLGSVCEFNYGKSLPQQNRIYGNIPVYGSNGIVGYHNQPLVPEPTIIVGRKGAAGAVHLTSEPCFPIDTTYYVTHSEDVDRNFLYYLMTTLRLGSFDKSTAIPGLNRNDAYRIDVPFPPLPIQHQIVARIEELFSEVDAGVKELQTALKQLKTYRQAVLHHYLSNEEWRLVRIGDVSSVHVGATPSRKVQQYWGGNINWVSSGEVAFRNIYNSKEKITTEGLQNSSTTVHPIGTVLLAMIGEGKTRGQAAILQTEAAHNQNTAAIRPIGSLLTTKFLYYHLVRSYNDNRRIGSGNNQQALNKSRVQEMTFRLPDLETQTTILAEIEAKLSEAEAMETAIRESLVKAEALRQSILKQAFEGKLLSGEPNDPPAVRTVPAVPTPTQTGRAAQMNLFE